MSASRRLAFIYLNSPQTAAVATAAAESSAAAPGRAGMPRRAWLRRIAAWLVGGLAGGGVAGGPVGKSDLLGEIPLRYLANNHLRRDIGLPPVLPDGWPH